MNTLALAGRCILVVEEEPAIALQLEAQLNAAGAKVYSAYRLREALYMAEHPALSAAIIDFRLGEDSSAAVCRRLQDLGIPFVFCTGHSQDDAFRRWPDAPVVSKPVDDGALVHAVASLLHRWSTNGVGQAVLADDVPGQLARPGLDAVASRFTTPSTRSPIPR